MNHAFGIRLASVEVSGILQTRTDGEVMGVLVRCLGVRYAVIQSSCNKDRPGRLVIAYQDEDVLRDLIAAPSILRAGVASREEAMANLKGLAPDVTPSKQKPRIRTTFSATQEDGVFASGHSSVDHRRIPRSIFQSALGVLIALFYSKSLVAVMIRMALGASF